MKVFLFLPFLIFSAWAAKPDTHSNDSYKNFVNSSLLQLNRVDHVVSEHIVNMIKLIEKGRVNQDVLKKTITEVAKSKHFPMFVPWLKSIHTISKLGKTEELTAHCRQYIERKEHLPLEKVLERISGNYCRERTLESISRSIEKTKELSDDSRLFIQENLRFFLTKKNKKNFSFFIQAQSTKTEIMKKLSQDVTSYSVSHEIVPSHEVLKDIVINEQITKLIQDKGFNPLQHQNVFYAEFGKLIEVGYKTIDKEPVENKVKEHFTFMKNYLELNQAHLPMGLCLSRLNDFSKAVFRGGLKDLSRDIFKFIIKSNQKDIIEDALFFYLWTYISQNEFKDALKIADKYNLLDKKLSIADPRLKFWIGYSFENTNKSDEAVKLYEEIIQNNPLSYYAIMGMKKLQSVKPDSRVVSFYRSSAGDSIGQVSFQATDLDEDYLSSLVRLRAWSKIDSIRMVKLELKRINLHNAPDFLVKFPSDKQLIIKSDLHIVNAKLIQESMNHLAAFKYLYVALDSKEVVFNRALLETLYPKPYFEDLASNLKNDSLDPIVVLSLIRQESVFNPLARSPVGARGLMQLMPMTAKRLRRSVSDRNLVDPKINIELGTKYFKNLLKRYDGNLVYVLSAYNAGESRVERWRNLYFNTDESILKNIESIPFLETRNYVKLIFRNIFFYKLLLENKDLADTGEPNKIYNISLGFKH